MQEQQAAATWSECNNIMNLTEKGGLNGARTETIICRVAKATAENQWQSISTSARDRRERERARERERVCVCFTSRFEFKEVSILE